MTREIRIELGQLMDELFGDGWQSVREDMGPLAKAYDSIMDKDHCPMDTLARFGLTGEDIKEAKSIIDTVTITSTFKGYDPKLTITSIFLSGLFTGLELERTRNAETQT